MGVDKATMLWAGQRGVDRLADLARRMGAAEVLTVGRRSVGLAAVLDEEEGAGPVGGIVAGLSVLRRAGCSRAIVLAVDAPTITEPDVEPLLAARPPGAVYEGLHLPLAIDLDVALPTSIAGWPIARFIDAAQLRRIPCPRDAAPRLRGANTPLERQALIAELEGRKG
jgi:molybdopterin-guanine dinucleotide biosynthesis protein A